MAQVAIIGAGPAGLMAAERLSAAGTAVTIFDRMPNPGRKFLMAGRGGLNLTHAEPLDLFLTRYGTARDFLAPAITSFPPDHLVTWCEALGQPTFVGTSGRIFPKSFKASPLLRAWLKRLQEQGVIFSLGVAWTGWGPDGGLTFSDAERNCRPDAVLLALGGASWPKLGSTGEWAAYLRQHGIAVTPFRPANSGLLIPWSEKFRDRFVGQPLKSIRLSHQGNAVAGDVMVTRTGLEGTPAYTLSPRLRDQKGGLIHIDLKPGLKADDILRKISVPRKRQSLSTFLQKQLNLPPIALGCLYETQVQGASIPESSPALAAFLKTLPLTVTGTAGLDRAISSAGGIALAEIDTNFMLKKKPGVFVAGEMLDWEAPTGGYLLQACCSTGRAAAAGLLKYLDETVPEQI